MGNPYATENWLRKQLALRDARISDLEKCQAELEALRRLAHMLVDDLGILKPDGAPTYEVTGETMAALRAARDVGGW